MLYCDCYQPDYRSGSGDGYVFCNDNNVCECPVADGGNSQYQCCTADSGGLTGINGCKSGCKLCIFIIHLLLFLSVAIMKLSHCCLLLSLSVKCYDFGGAGVYYACVPADF